MPFPVVTTGTFDGVHLGHQAILKRLFETAKRKNGTSVVITFHPHPRLVLQKGNSQVELLNTLNERITNLEKAGVDAVLVIPFTREFSSWSSDEFISRVLVESIGTRSLVIGYDHQFGHNREGSFENLKLSGLSAGFEVEEIPAQDVDEVAVSSTKIRNALHNGDIETANQFLGYAYPLEGDVIHGDSLGRTIGYPTANIQVQDPNKLIPQNGVYAVSVHFDGQSLKGMMNIGTRPTVTQTGERRLEVNILNWRGDLYNKCIQIRLHKRIRNEVRFNSIEELKAQLGLDRLAADELLDTYIYE